jgi:23S rRNA (cytosine1962-C5)-methyltransferase
MPESNEAFANRLRKNARHFHRWAKTHTVTAYRLYDRDLPDVPVDVDWYDGRVVLTAYATRRAVEPATLDALRAVVMDVLSVSRPNIYVKVRSPKKWGDAQYERMEDTGEPFTVQEQGLRFWVDLCTHLDTGLFLDHRVTRARVREEASGKRVLNLFAYTGAFSVYAAAGGAKATTSVDLSNTYLTTARRNLALNGLDGAHHAFVRADAKEWLGAQKPGPSFDLVVMDPPSYSASKGMRGTLEIQRDHPRLIAEALGLLSPAGVLYFSTHFRGFQLAAETLASAHFEELTPRSIPEDFRRKDIHRCWRVSLTPGRASR